MNAFLILPFIIPLINAASYTCDTMDCNKEFIFNEPEADTSFYCNQAGKCTNLVIYYAGSSTLNLFCSVPDACVGTQVYCGNWPPQITNIAANINCNVNCNSDTAVACHNVFFSCKGEAGEIDGCWMGSTESARTINDCTMECNTGNSNCEWDCSGTGCCKDGSDDCSGPNEMLCHTPAPNENCHCTSGNCGSVDRYYDQTYPPTSPTTTTPSPTPLPTPSPTPSPTHSPTTQSPTTDSPTTDSPTFLPTTIPTAMPTFMPTTIPTLMPTTIPTFIPTSMPTTFPTKIPTNDPVTNSPTILPTNEPTTGTPTTYEPSGFPTTGSPTNSTPTTVGQTYADGIVGDMTTSNGEKSGDTEHVLNGGIFGMDSTMFLFVVGGSVIVCLVCVLIWLIHITIKKRKEFATANANVVHSTSEVEMEGNDFSPSQLQITAINSTSQIIAKRQSVSKSEDSANSLYMDANDVINITCTASPGTESVIKNVGENDLEDSDGELDEMYTQTEDKHYIGSMSATVGFMQTAGVMRTLKSIDSGIETRFDTT